MFDLATPVENLYLIGPARAKLLKHLGINTLADLLYYFPRAHQDLSHFTPIAELQIGDFANVKARVLEIKSFRTKVRRLTLTQALIEDDSGTITCVWFNQPFLTKVIHSQETFIFSGKILKSKNKLQMQNPIYEQEKAEQVHTSRLVPVYPLTASLTQKILRSIIKTYLDKTTLPEFLPSEIIAQEKLFDENRAVKTFHFPADWPALKTAQKRLAFDEVFLTQLRVLKYKKERMQEPVLPIKLVPDLADKIKSLPFELTATQARALQEILADFTKPYPANRLLEGDVGSGKTILAALAMWLASKNNLQSALLCPTEVLAQQHYINFLKLFLNDGFDLAIMTGSSIRLNGNPVSSATLLAQIRSGKVKMILGTHALLEEKVNFKNLSLVVIDEQHRFGVKQRATLKNFNNTHLLSMSATPIPRTLALTLYGDLDISRLDQLPSGRLPIKTELIDNVHRTSTYNFIRSQIKDGRQAFVICPLIEESDKLGVKSATAEYKKLSEEIYPDLKIGLLHGKLKPADKEKIMQKFKDNEIQILVSTSVVEVGVDVPNATVMLIEGAERFGLAQLHQFRGRVGRASFQSYCFLFSEDPNAMVNPRLLAVVRSTNGFELAEEDLKIRGAGNLYGTEQSGYSFKIATLSNLEMVERSKQYAEALVEADSTFAAYPLLKQRIEKQPVIHLE
ncbi:MAG: ATP-dependent DNA helicase RecG [Candidatus Doudnabacteria bacterium]|nr:ATP-dependent DNA helicase RecG [Candidatus Doudnabacteria bacterium]